MPIDPVGATKSNHEQCEALGIPASEYEATTTSTKGRYVEIPNDKFGYPGEYEKGLEARQRNVRDSTEAAEYNNNEIV